MKKLLIIFCLFCFCYSFSQTHKEIKHLEYANNMIEVPENCTAKSKYELLDCNGVSAQWIYFNEEMLVTVAEQMIEQYSKNSTSKEKIEVLSYGATLEGYHFTFKNQKNSNRIIVYGTVNKQPLILNVASEDELIGVIAESNELLKKIISIKK